MKCPNCGGEVSVNEIKCSYCGTPNPEGLAFQGEVRKRRRFNVQLKQQIEKQMALPLKIRVLNLSLVVLAILFFVLLLFNLVLYMFLEGVFTPEPEESPAETQAYLLQYDYDQFLHHSMSCMEELEKGLLPSTYDMEYTIREAQSLFYPDIPAYPDIYPENEEALENWQEEARIFLIGTFGFADAEFQLMAPSDEYDWFSQEELNALSTAAYQHLGEVYYEKIN